AQLARQPCRHGEPEHLVEVDAGGLLDRVRVEAEALVGAKLLSQLWVGEVAEARADVHRAAEPGRRREQAGAALDREVLERPAAPGHLRDHRTDLGWRAEGVCRGDSCSEIGRADGWTSLT